MHIGPHVKCPLFLYEFNGTRMYEGHLESKERFAIQRYLLIIGKKKNMQVYDTPSPTSPHSHLGH